MARPSGRDIRREAVVAAQEAIQSRGPSSFSYGDLAARLDVRAPSLHHHFARRSDLVAAATRSYRERFRERVETIEPGPAIDDLREYVSIFLQPATRALMCLCGAIVAGWDDVEPDTRNEVERFLADERAWLAARFADAAADGDLRAGADPDALATLLLSTLEGALLGARAGLAGSTDAPLLVLDLAARDR